MLIGVDGTIFTKQRTGIGNYAYELLHRLPQYLPNAKFVIFSPNRPPADWALPQERFRWVEDCRFYERPMVAYKAFGMAFAAAREKIDVFWAAAGGAPFFMPCPVVLTVHDFVYLVESQSMPLARRVFRSFSQPYWIKHASKVLSNSAAVGEETKKYIGRQVDGVIRPAADATFYPRTNSEVDHVKQKYGISRAYYLIVGTLEPRKNLQLFLETYLDQIALVKETMPLLVISGPVGWKVGEIASLIERAVQRGIAIAIGYAELSDLPALYSGANILFMPSRYEGFGMPVLEARMCGCRVVCSDVPAMREAGGEATLYHAPTREGLRLAINQVFANKVSFDKKSVPQVEWTWESGAQQLSAYLKK